MRRKLPYQSQPTRIHATDSASTAASIYSLELKRKSLRERHEFMSQTLAQIEQELTRIERQLADLHDRQNTMFAATRIEPAVNYDLDDDALSIDY